MSEPTVKQLHRQSVAVNRRLHDEARILTAAAAIMDGRSSHARDYRRMAQVMLAARSQIDALQTRLNLVGGLSR